MRYSTCPREATGIPAPCLPPGVATTNPTDFSPPLSSVSCLISAAGEGTVGECMLLVRLLLICALAPCGCRRVLVPTTRGKCLASSFVDGAFERRYALYSGNVGLRRSPASNGWSVVATKPLKAGAEVLTLPWSEAITVAHAEALDPAFSEQRILEILHTTRHSKEHTHFLLATLLLVEHAKASHSRWAEYIAMLPREFTHVGYATDHEAKCLLPSQQFLRNKTHAAWKQS